MAKKTQYSKIKIKRSSVAGVIPTMGPSSDHTDGSWNGTDIYPGEFFINLADNRVWFGSLSGPTEIVVPGTFGAQAITYSDLSTLKTAGGLTPGQLYIITDRGDQGIIISAIDDSNLSISGTRIMNCPAATFYTIAGINLGVWNLGLTPTAGDKVVWGGKVWTNNAGVVGTATDDETLSADWTVVAKPSYGTSNASYDTLVFDIKYDFDNDWISEQADLNGNIFGLSYQEAMLSLEFSSGLNPVNISDWNRSLLFNNRCIGVWNNSRTGYISYNQSRYGNISNNSVGTDIKENYNFYSISDNSNGGSISNNSIVLNIINNSNTGSINNNANNGDISNNSILTFIANNSNNGSIIDNSNTGSINNNANNGNIDDNSNNGNIDYNSCWLIASNSNNGGIFNNSNNGIIAGCASPATDIYNNINNGDINGYSTVGVLFDTIVNK